MQLNPRDDYGFVDNGISNTDTLPIWDSFRLEKIRYIYQTSPMILDFGKSARALAKLFADELRDKKMISVDISELVKPDVVADICNLHMFQDNSIDGIVCASILNHVYNPFKAIEELYRVLKPKGKIFIYVAWLHRYMGWPPLLYDYYRFSAEGVRYLLKNFSSIEISPVMGKIETSLNLFPVVGKRSLFHKLFARMIRKIDTCNEHDAAGYNIYAVK